MSATPPTLQENWQSPITPLPQARTRAKDQHGIGSPGNLRGVVASALPHPIDASGCSGLRERLVSYPQDSPIAVSKLASLLFSTGHRDTLDFYCIAAGWICRCPSQCSHGRASSPDVLRAAAGFARSARGSAAAWAAAFIHPLHSRSIYSTQITATPHSLADHSFSCVDCHESDLS